MPASYLSLGLGVNLNKANSLVLRGRGSRWAVIRLNSAGIILKWKVQEQKAEGFQPPRGERKGALLCLKAAEPGETNSPRPMAVRSWAGKSQSPRIPEVGKAL